MGLHAGTGFAYSFIMKTICSLGMRLLHGAAGIAFIIISPILAVAMGMIYVSRHSFLSEACEDFSGSFKWWFVGGAAQGIGQVFPRYARAGWYRAHNGRGSCGAWTFWWVPPTLVERDGDNGWLFYNAGPDGPYWSPEFERNDIACLPSGPGLALGFLLICAIAGTELCLAVAGHVFHLRLVVSS
jgi:hypothetical protein